MIEQEELPLPQPQPSSFPKSQRLRELSDEEQRRSTGGQSYPSSDFYNDPMAQLFVRYPDHPAHRD